MKHVAAYLLLRLGGKDKPTEDDVNALLDVFGEKGDSECMERLFNEIGDKDVNELIEAGRDKLVIVGGGAAGGAAPAGSGDAPAEEAAPAEEEEEEEEES